MSRRRARILPIGANTQVSRLERKHLWILSAAVAFFVLAATITLLSPEAPTDAGLAEEELPDRRVQRRDR